MHRGFALSECPTSPSTGQRPLCGENSVVKKTWVVFLASASILVARSSLSLKAQKIGLGAGPKFQVCFWGLLFDVTVAGIRSPLNIRRSLPLV